MLRRAPKTALGIATAALALLDWMAGATIAEPDGPDGAPPPDEMVPAGASLENTTASTAQVGPVAIRILPAGQRYVLEAYNPSTTDQDIEVDVKVLETNVNPIARMAPMPQEVAGEKVALHCPAGQRIRHALALAGLAPAPVRSARAATASNSNAGSNAGGVGLGFQSFTTREFLVSSASPRAPQAQAQRASRNPSAASLGLGFGRPAGQTVLRVALGPTARAASSR